MDHQSICEARRDIHRRSVIQPEFYSFVGWYCLGVGGAKTVLKCSEVLKAFVVSEEARDFKAEIVYGAFGICGVCGARFAMGEVWQHQETREMIHIGHECAAKYEMVSGTDWTAIRSERERTLKAERTKARRSQNHARIEKAYPGLLAALKSNHRIIRDIARRYEQNATISDAQIKLVFKIVDDLKKRAAQQTEVNVAAPKGRVLVHGIVVSRREQESEFGVATRITVKVATDAGVWLAWGTAPAAIVKDVKCGDEVEFTATLKAGREPHFALATRPTGGRIVTAASVGPAH